MTDEIEVAQDDVKIEPSEDDLRTEPTVDDLGIYVEEP